MRRWHEVADDVHWIEHGNVNSYLLGEGGSYTLVDAGLPGTWGLLQHVLDALGADLQDLRAVVLTHGHFDHVGLARRLQRRTAVPVLVHGADAALVAHPYRYAAERPVWTYPARFPRAVPGLLSMAAVGAAWVRGTELVTTVADGDVLDVPGRPRVVHTPGHTDGHCALHVADRGVVLTGDALVTRDPYTARAGPRIVARAATASVARARESLERLRGTGAAVVLPGHGDPWTRGVGRAVDVAVGRAVP